MSPGQLFVLRLGGEVGEVVAQAAYEDVEVVEFVAGHLPRCVGPAEFVRPVGEGDSVFVGGFQLVDVQ